MKLRIFYICVNICVVTEAYAYITDIIQTYLKICHGLER